MSRRDSSGVEIIDTPNASWSREEAWVVSPTPELAIGLTEGDAPYLFGSITGATRLDDGSIAISDGQALVVRYFDARGQFLREVGGGGDGPGEFNSIYALLKCGDDQLYADDRMARRISVWSGEGVLEREFDLLEPTPERLRGPYQWTCSTDGAIIAAGWGDRGALMRATESHFFLQSAPIWVLDSIGDPTLELGEYVVSERVFIYNPASGGGSSAPHPFGRAVSFALGTEEIYVGTGERLDIAVYDRGGKMLRMLRGPAEELSVDNQLLERYLREDLPGSTNVLLRRIQESALPLPGGLPAYSEMRLDPEDHLWVKRFQHPWETRSRWGVFSPEGEFLGHVDMPDRIAVLEIGSDYVLGVTRDDLDVQSIRLHPLTRRGR